MYFESKVRWNHMHRNVALSAEQSLKNLGVDYIDLLLIHCLHIF